MAPGENEFSFHFILNRTPLLSLSEKRSLSPIRLPSCAAPGFAGLPPEPPAVPLQGPTPGPLLKSYSRGRSSPTEFSSFPRTFPFKESFKYLQALAAGESWGMGFLFAPLPGASPAVGAGQAGVDGLHQV